MPDLPQYSMQHAWPNTLKDKTIVVIGGSAGIGRALAEAAVAAGARVFAVSRSGNAPAGAEGLAADLQDHSALAAAMAHAKHIDHLAFTAGIRAGASPLATLDAQLLQSSFETKLFNALHAVRLALPYLAPRASITFTSGVVSRKFGAGTAVKGAFNAAVDAAGKHLAKELALRRVNVISPGVVDTDLWGEAGSTARRATIDRISAALPVGRVAAPDELAHAYLFAMTNEFLTGAVLDIDGGGLL